MASAQLRLRIVSRPAPATRNGHPTEFGLQDKKKNLVAGVAHRDALQFDLDVPVKQHVSGEPRFGGPFVHAGSKGAQHLYLGWRQVGESGWINRLKVHLDLSWNDVAGAIEDGAVMVVDATGPEWGVLKDWHGLNVGREWRRVG